MAEWRLDHGLLLHQRCRRWEELGVVAFISTPEALRKCPWHAAAPVIPLPATKDQEEKREAEQHECHALAVGTEDIEGYATWVAAGLAPPLRLCETEAHTGTRIWHGSWLHRQWVIENVDLLNSAESVIELGAGCGLLGMTISSMCPNLQVTMSDFAGHFDGGEEASVVSNLVDNVERNKQLLGKRAKVIELDWCRPHKPVLRWPSRGATELDAADVVVATEVLYTKDGASLFLSTLQHCLKPHGVAYVLNNAHRTGVDLFEESAAKMGLDVSRLPVPSMPKEDVFSPFVPSSDDDYVFFRICAI